MENLEFSLIDPFLKIFKFETEDFKIQLIEI